MQRLGRGGGRREGSIERSGRGGEWRREGVKVRVEVMNGNGNANGVKENGGGKLRREEKGKERRGGNVED